MNSRVTQVAKESSVPAETFGTLSSSSEVHPRGREGLCLSVLLLLLVRFGKIYGHGPAPLDTTEAMCLLRLWFSRISLGCWLTAPGGLQWLRRSGTPGHHAPELDLTHLRLSLSRCSLPALGCKGIFLFSLYLPEHNWRCILSGGCGQGPCAQQGSMTSGASLIPASEKPACTRGTNSASFWAFVVYIYKTV
jgi:hypothetical protein